MSIYIGNNKYKEIYLGSNKISEVYLGSNKIFSGVDPYNPLGLPPNTVRVRTTNGNAPIKYSDTSYETATLVSGTNNIYDIYKSGTSFKYLLNGSSNVAAVLGANATGITDMSYMFQYCDALTSVPLFDTSSVTAMNGMFASSGITTVPLFDTSSVTAMNGMFASSSITTVPLFDTSNVTIMSNMFAGCESLTTVPLFDTSNVTTMPYMFQYCDALTAIPLFDTSKVTNMTRTFDDCTKVESGALALYQQASTQTRPPSSHTYCFRNCGSDTTTGAAELAQIPSSWGGTAS